LFIKMTVLAYPIPSSASQTTAFLLHQQ